MTHQPSGRVLVLGDNDLASLAIVRSLGRAGLDVHLVLTETKPITRHSRYVRQTYDLGNPVSEGPQFIENLLQAVMGQKFDLVIPVADKTLLPLFAERDRFREFTRLAIPNETGYEVAFHKDKTIELARELGVPVPDTHLLTAPHEMERLSGDTEFPLVLKPQFSTSLTSTRRNEVKIVGSADELHQKLPEMLTRSPVLVQSFCPGQGAGVSILADRGEVFAAFQHQRVHEPPRGGAGAYRQSVPLRDDLLQAVRKMCEQMEWTGPAMFEFKIDPRTNEAVLMEINGRFWGSLALAVGAGVDFPRLLYDFLVLDKKTPTFTYKSPYYMRHTLRDIWWFWANLRTPSGNPELLKVPWSRVCGELGHIVTLREGYDVESITDPLPAVYGWSGFVKDITGTLWSKLGRRSHARQAQRLVLRTRQNDPEIVRRIAAADSVLFICFGNINRSAVAAIRFRELLQTAPHPVAVTSAGFYPEENRPTSPLSSEVARELGIDLSEHRSRTVTAEMLDQHDLIVAMDSSHLESLQKNWPDAVPRTILLSAFDDSEQDVDIPDPHGKSRETFHKTYARIVRCVDRLAQSVASTKPNA